MVSYLLLDSGTPLSVIRPGRCYWRQQDGEACNQAPGRSGELLLGLWLLVSPWVLKYAAERSLMLSAIVLGALITAVAGAALYRVSAWKRFANMALGLCAIVDPRRLIRKA